MSDSNKAPEFNEISVSEWAAAHDKSVVEYPSTRLLLFRNGPLVRIAFGQLGHPIDAAGKLSEPRYNVAVSLPPAVAMQLRDLLTQIYPSERTGPEQPHAVGRPTRVQKGPKKLS